MPAGSIPVKTPPVFPGPTGKDEGSIGKAQWEEPLLGPEGQTVGSPGMLTNKRAMHQNMAMSDPTIAESLPFPGVVSSDDFPGKEAFSPGTRGHLIDEAVD